MRGYLLYKYLMVISLIDVGYTKKIRLLSLYYEGSLLLTIKKVRFSAIDNQESVWGRRVTEKDKLEKKIEVLFTII